MNCGHKKSCKCSNSEDLEKLKCSELVEFSHELCHHRDTRSCWNKKKRCETPVAMRCSSCGEESEVKCYIRKDRPEEFKCCKPCTRRMSCIFG